MQQSGVRHDDPEYIKAHNILSAVQKQQAFAKQRLQQQQQFQRQQQLQQQQQMNGNNADAIANGANGMLFCALCVVNIVSDSLFLFFRSIWLSSVCLQWSSRSELSSYRRPTQPRPKRTSRPSQKSVSVGRSKLFV